MHKHEPFITTQSRTFASSLRIVRLENHVTMRSERSASTGSTVHPFKWICFDRS
jgi:hypothetical protein